MFRIAFSLALVAVSPVAADDKPQRLPRDKAKEVIADFLRRQTPDIKLGGDYGVVELTTDAVWERLSVQVFKVSGEVRRNEAYVVRGKDVIPIGMAFGGDGVTTLAVADLAGDGKPLLVFAFAWGSGVHRSQIGVLDLSAREPRSTGAAPSNFSFTDYSVKGVDARTVQVFVGKQLVGVVTAERKDGTLSASIKLEEKIPDDIRKSLR